MALKSTIFKAELQISDVDRGCYERCALTLARHPSETDERMMLRLLAYALNVAPGLALCKGLSDTDEPDLWIKDLTGACQRWIELGLPDERRVLKACGIAEQVVIYAYGGNAARLWWQSAEPKLARAHNLTVMHIPQDAVRQLGALAQRNMRLQFMRQDDRIMLASENALVEFEPEVWRQAS